MPDPGPSSSPPVILHSGDLTREIHHFGLEPTTLLRATDWRGLYAQSGRYEIRAARVHVATNLRDATHDTVFTITADPPDRIVLFSGISAIQPGPVTYSSHYQAEFAKCTDLVRMGCATGRTSGWSGHAMPLIIRDHPHGIFALL